LKKIFSIFLLLILFPVICHSDDLDIFSGDESGGSKSVNVEGKVISRFTLDINKDSKYEFTKELRNKFFLSVNGDINPEITFKFSVLDKYYIFYSDYEETNDNTLSIFEGVVNYSADKFDLHLGKQSVTWGLSDVSPLDVVNPTEMEEFIFTEEEFVKIPVLMANIDYFISDNTTIEGIYVPFYVPSHFSMLDSDWSLMPRSLYYSQIQQYEDSFDKDFSSQDMTPYYMKYPSDSPFNGEIGGLLKYYGTGIDFQFAFHYGWEKMPFPEFNPQLVEYLKNSNSPMDDINNLSLPETISFSPLMKFEPKRVFTLGGGVSSSFKGVGIRSEFAIGYKASLYSRHLELLRVPSLTMNVGADYSFPYNLYGNMVLTMAHFFTNEDTYLFSKTNIFLIAFIRGSYMHDSLLPQIKFMYDFSQNEYFVSIDSVYSYSDNITFDLGIYILEGDKGTLLYQFKNNDNCFLSVKYSF